MMSITKLVIVGLLAFFAGVYSSCETKNPIKPITKCVLDTDGALDDILSLIMMMEAERVDNGPKIIAITVVNGVSTLDNGVMNILKTLKALNRTDIPVYAGAASPLMLPDVKGESYGRDGFGDFEFPDPPSRDLVQEKHAAVALIDIVRRYPGEVTVITIAPPTNIALAIKLNPNFLNELCQFIIMGGSVEGRGNVLPGIDYNSWVDPEANYIVWDSAKKTKPITLIYLETTIRARTTMKFRLSFNELNNTRSWLIRNGERTALNATEEFWYCPDAVAIVVATSSGSIITRTESYYVEAIYEGAKTKGMTIADYTNITKHPANTHLVQDIDFEEYKRLLYRYFS